MFLICFCQSPKFEFTFSCILYICHFYPPTLNSTQNNYICKCQSSKASLLVVSHNKLLRLRFHSFLTVVVSKGSLQQYQVSDVLDATEG